LLPPFTQPLQRLAATAAFVLAGAGLACGGSSRPALKSIPTPSQRPSPNELPSIVSHTVRPGETLWKISHAYGADLEEISAVNGLGESALIQVGQVLIIPAPGRLPSATPSGALLRWPLQGEIRSRFGLRGRRHHDGLDIDGHQGDPIHAAADGEVVVARSWGAYGKTIILDHGGGLRTLYAHASRLLVNTGERVRAGQAIARVGRTGNATGTHLHFELQKDGKVIDPMNHLSTRPPRAATAR